MAKLPAGLTQPCIRDMKVGASGWTVPWAMMVDGEQNCYLNGHYSVDRAQGGTAQMRVDRNDDGYAVYIPKGFKYNPCRTVPWAGATEDDRIPVASATLADWSYGGHR
jgi:hypothetical protein